MFGKKGQAAMEYLMTYGWALLVIFIVIAVLYFLSQSFGGEGCTFEQAGFTCNQPSLPILKTDSKLIGRIGNGFGKSIQILEVACTQDRSKLVLGGSPTLIGGAYVPGATGPTLVPQAYLDLANLVPAGTLKCAALDNSVPTLSAGADYRGVLFVRYRFTDDPTTGYERVAKASLVTKVQQ